MITEQYPYINAMGTSMESLLHWMNEVAKARLLGSKRTVELKFTANTLNWDVD